MEEKGYMAGLMFSSGRVVRGVGGGVCVASTVLYNAALNAGFPILERWMHSGPTSYAEATRDAAVVYGHKDLRVKNNLDDAVWVRCIVDEEVVRVSLLTLHRPPYAVSLREEGPGYIPSPLTLEETDGEGPEVLAEGSPGCDRTLIREFRQNGKLVRQETICRDIRKPVMRIVGLPRQLAGSDMLEIPQDLGGSAMPEPHLPPQKVEPAHRPIQVEPRLSL